MNFKLDLGIKNKEIAKRCVKRKVVDPLLANPYLLGIT